jgi:hypothetical protein
MRNNVSFKGCMWEAGAATVALGTMWFLAVPLAHWARALAVRLPGAVVSATLQPTFVCLLAAILLSSPELQVCPFGSNIGNFPQLLISCKHLVAACLNHEWHMLRRPWRYHHQLTWSKYSLAV